MANETNIMTQVINADNQVIPAYRFLLRVEGYQDVPLKSIRPFSKENEYEYIAEGGLNDYVHTVRKQASKPFTLVVERYVSQKFIDPLTNGMAMVLPMILFIGNADAQKFDFWAVRTYIFTGCVIMNKEVGGFDAEKSGLLTETITIGYENSFALNNIEDIMSERWEFPTSGPGERKYAAKDISSKTSAQNGIHWKDNMWTFDDLKVEGNGKRRAAKDEASTRKSETNGKADADRWYENANKIQKKPQKSAEGKDISLEASRKRAKENMWTFDGVAVEGNGNRHAAKDEASLRTSEADGKADAEKWYENADEIQKKPQRSAEGEDISLEASRERAKAKQWTFNDLEVQGNGKRYAAKDIHSTRKSEADGVSAAQKWYTDRTSNNTLSTAMPHRAGK